MGLVVAHEFGHFIAARRNKVEVEEFGIGFPPRMWSKKMPSGFRFSFNWLPLGGFVRLKGEHDADRTAGGFGAASLLAKLKIIAAGIVMNVVVAFVLFTILALTGLPKAQLELLPFYNKEQFSVKNDTKVVSNQVVVAVVPDSPADKAGLKDNDEITKIGDSTIESAGQLATITQKYAGQTVPIEVKRDKNAQLLTATLNAERTESQAYLGVSPIDVQVRRSTWSAPIVGAGLVAQYTEVSFKGLGYAFGNLVRGSGEAIQDTVVGPVGTVSILQDYSEAGLTFVIFFLALISLSLAIMNVLPIPALDGGRIFVTLLFRLMKRPLTRRTEELIHGTGFALLMGLFVVVTVLDIKRFL